MSYIPSGVNLKSGYKFHCEVWCRVLNGLHWLKQIRILPASSLGNGPMIRHFLIVFLASKPSMQLPKLPTILFLPEIASIFFVLKNRTVFSVFKLSDRTPALQSLYLPRTLPAIWLCKFDWSHLDHKTFCFFLVVWQPVWLRVADLNCKLYWESQLGTYTADDPMSTPNPYPHLSHFAN